MLFNSLEFAIFLPLSFLLYWFVFAENLRVQNFFVLICSYIFYGWWDWRFLGLIFASTLVDYTTGLFLEKIKSSYKRKLLLFVSLLINLGLLGFFKYYNFFLENLLAGLSGIGINSSFTTLNILLPVGISFYTFQTLSYTIDVYYKRIEPTKDFIAFAAFVSFFPQLVAGPIERAKHLLPQFLRNRKFDYVIAVDGMKQILWGLFKKIVIADNCAVYVDQIFTNTEHENGSTLFMGALLFAFQIYGDFSGYSDIAIGTSKLFGVRLSQNFAFPYFSRNIAEFWRRWHISLSTWFRDYVYIPLGGSRGSKLMRIRNILIIFLVSGFWHGANWTFIAWGGMHALLFMPILLFPEHKTTTGEVVAEGKQLPDLRSFLCILFTFLMVVLTWIIFRASNIHEAVEYYKGVFSESLFDKPEIFPGLIFLLIVFLMFVEWMGRDSSHALEKLFISKPKFVKLAFYLGVAFSIYLFQGRQQEFIYFQF